MSITLKDLTNILNQELKPWRYTDYAPNGLQVEGKAEVHKIISGVTACERLLDEAIKQKADAVLVHHGYFWKNEHPCITGIKQRRISKLLLNQISLLAYHLPLDAHPTLGNNAQLAEMLNINITGGLDLNTDNPTGNVGELAEPVSVFDFAEKIGNTVDRQPLVVEGGQHQVRTVALCTGAAQDYIDLAIERNADVFVSGEISERTVHIAREAGIHYIAAGHHATERYGVMALGEWLQKTQDIEHEFIDVPNPA